MDSWLRNEIEKSRKRYKNPYAHLNGEGMFDATFNEQSLSNPNLPEDIHETRRLLGNPYAYADELHNINDEHSEIGQPLISLDKIAPTSGKDKALSRKTIEKIARNLQKELWAQRSKIFPNRKDINALEIINPSIALMSLGYKVEMKESLGQHSGNGELYEVAGLIKKTESLVQISKRFSPEIRNFTMAHELGHALLHEESGLHRDRALDGSANNQTRPLREIQADIFASVFLIPEKQLKIAFNKLFLTDCFRLNNETAFALTSGSLELLESKCRTQRDLTKMLAGAEYYNGVHFNSLAIQFKVSIAAMAIRLEELNLAKMS